MISILEQLRELVEGRGERWEGYSSLEEDPRLSSRYEGYAEACMDIVSLIDELQEYCSDKEV